MAKMAAGTADDVFINCPFTEDYLPLFHCMLFTVMACGFRPRTALEAGDAGDVRLDKIIRLIKESPFSIHDLSAVELDAINHLPRFNMPFELGLVIGCKKIAGRKYASRPILVLEKTQYTYQKCLSDIAGQDTRSHNGSTDSVMRLVRAWLYQQSGRLNIPGNTRIATAYATFSRELPHICTVAGLAMPDLTYPDFVGFVQEWLVEH